MIMIETFGVMEVIYAIICGVVIVKSVETKEWEFCVVAIFGLVCMFIANYFNGFGVVIQY